MTYCARCLYPANARPAIIMDDDGVCSGCRYHESRARIDWGERERMLRELLEEFRRRSRERGQLYDCIVPVSGGKDSHFQVYLIKIVYGLNPLLVTFNHCFNTRLGIRDRAMLHLCFAAGLRVSELIGIRREELQLHPDATVHVRGKGRRERLLPLWKHTAAALRMWL